MIIDELERLKTKDLSNRRWTDDEDDTLKRYYRQVPRADLLTWLPGRNYNSIRVHVSTMKKKGKWKQL